jgi:spore maturation protein CgeB
MLITRSTFHRVGGFDPAYQFGTEDVDLGLKLVHGGAQLAGVGRSVLVHRESSTQNRGDTSVRRVNRTANRRVFLERWGPSLFRAYRLGRLHQDLLWTDGQGPHIAITVTNLDPGAGWGDWYTAHELGGALESLGWRVSYIQRKGDEWYSLPDDLEYVLALMDPFDLRNVPEHVTVIAWIRNWTERWLERTWFGRIDVILASSAQSAELIRQATGMPSIHFPLATNPARFFGAQPSPELACDFVYVANRWGEERKVERAAAPRAGERFRVFGRGWEAVKQIRPYYEGPADYEALPAVYASAKLVLDDTQGPTLPYGAVNGRVFDALAAGALPVTDCEAGVRELFDDDFPVWNSTESLRARIDELLGNEQARLKLVRRYRDVVLRHHTYSQRAHQLRDVLIDHEYKLSFAIKIGAPNHDAALRWGDLHFAESLSRELHRRGHRALIQTLDEWDDEAGLRRDVVVHLKGLTRYHPKPGQVNVLWSISHPAELTGEECDGFDLVCVASAHFAQQLRPRTSTPVVVLEQATDPRVFTHDPRPELAHELAYVANSRNVLRPMMRDLLPTKRDLAVWGANWKDLIPDSYVVAEHVPNDQLRHVYSSAQIVLCDHWDDMRASGYISNRIYDALACGAFVLSDDVLGLRGRFGEAIATYTTREELHDLIARFLPDSDERRRRAAIGQRIVLESHTFAHMTDRLLGEIDSLRPDEYLRRLGDMASRPLRVPTDEGNRAPGHGTVEAAVDDPEPTVS